MERVDFEQWKPKEVARLLALVEGGRRYYQNLVAMLPVPLIVLSSDRSVVFANRAFRQVFGLRAEDLGRMSIDQILPCDRLIEKIRDLHVHGIAQPGFSVEAGEKLIIPAARPVEETKSRLVRYRVRRGDTLGGIADQFSVTGEDLRKWNGLKGGKVSRGMVLRIYTVGGAPETRTVKSSAKTRRKKPAGGVANKGGSQTKP